MAAEPKVFDEDSSMMVHGAGAPNLTFVAGTPDDDLADVTATPTQAIVNANFRDVADKINKILAALRSAGIIAAD